jgi:hypothetical protein
VTGIGLFRLSGRLFALGVLTMCANFSELAHHLAVMHAHITHISRLAGEMVICIESRSGKRLALDLSNAAFQLSINAQELDAEARRVRQIADDLISPTKR